MGMSRDPSVIIAEALGPLLKMAMGPYVKKGFFGKWKTGAFEIGYIQRLCEAIGDAMFLNEEVIHRAHVRILAEYFHVDIVKIPSLVSLNPQKYAEGILLGDRRFKETMKHSEVFENLQHEVLMDVVNNAPTQQRAVG
jgi:hypothetical protein